MPDRGKSILAFAENLLLEKQPVQPKELILLSPWLDLTMSNPEIHAVEKVDRMLHLGALRAAAKAYSGGSDLSNYLLSPINGETSGLGKISIFIGTHDILEPDCRKFRDQVNRSGGSIIFHEYRDMQHVWMLFPIPEARDAFREIVDQLSKY